MTGQQSYDGRVVVGFDGSEVARQATEWAAHEARTRGRELTLVHAVLPPVTTGGLGVGLPPSLDLIEQLQAQAADQLDQLASQLAGLHVETAVVIGAPSAVLLDASAHAHLVVIGSRGRGGFAGLLLGSVSSQVAAHSACPVAVIRNAPARGTATVLVGTDGSPAAEAALAFAFDHASRNTWRVVALHAWDVPAYDLLVVPSGPIPVPLADVADDEVRLAAEVLAGFREDYPDVEVEERLVRGPAVQSLVSAAADADLVVVGSHGRGALTGALLGSVSLGVLHKSRTPVVVTPPIAQGPHAA